MIALGSREARRIAVAASGFLAFVSLALVSRIAAAAPETGTTSVELRYAVGDGIAGCLSEAAFHDAVRSRLPHQSLASERPIVVSTSIDRDGRRLRATVTLREDGSAGAPVEASQEIFASPHECATLSAAAALAVSLAIERARSHPPSPPPLTTAPEAAPAPASRSRRPARRRPLPRERKPAPSGRELRTHAALAGSYGMLPSASIGASFGASLKLADRWSAGLEARAWLPATVESSSGRAGAKAWLVLAEPSACAHASHGFVCAVGAVGDFRAVGTGRLLSRSTDSTYLALGARVGTEIPVGRPFSLVIHGSALVPLLRPALRIEDELLWRGPLVAGEIGVGVRMSIL